jgi:hypothetical protein
MGLGPFSTYVPPGVYTRTLTEANVTGITNGLRIPAYIGVGQEELEQDDYEMVRGSSSTLDQQIVAEDVTESYVVDETNPNNPILGATDGTLSKVRVRNFPIVDGQGLGRTTNDVRSVTVTVNGTPVAVGSVQGAKGYVILQVPPQPTDNVRVTYYFHRGDTAFQDDLSSQVTPTNAMLTTPAAEPFVVVAGQSDSFTLIVNGTSYTIPLAAGSQSAAALKSLIDSALIPNLTTNVYTDEKGLNHVQFNAPVSLVIGTGNANGVLGFTQGNSTSRNAQFVVFNRPIVDGSGGGITTTDPSKVVVKVNGVQVIPSSVDGKNGVVTLSAPPAPGASVIISYWANTWQNTFDYLPNTLVTTVLRCGISPGRNDYIENTDFVVSNPRPDVSIVHWGTSFVVAPANTTTGATPFDESQIIPTLVDDRLYLAHCVRVTDTSTVPATVSTNQFTLPAVPTMGNGRDTPLGSTLFSSVSNSRQALPTARPDLVTVRVGRTLLDALNRPAATVLEVDPVTLIVTLKDAVPPDFNAYATFWYNRIEDTTYIFTCTVPGAVGAGQYTVFDTTTAANLYQVLFGTKGGGLTNIVQWPRQSEKVPDAFHFGGAPVSEIVTVTFSQSAAKNAAYTNKGAEPYNFYAGTSSSWVSIVNGISATTNLSTAAPAVIVGGHVTPIQTGVNAGKITIPASPNDVLNLNIDGVSVPVTLTAGYRTAAQILTDINAAIDVAFPGSAPNAAATSFQIGGATGDIIFAIKGITTPAALPTGFDSVSDVKVNQGTVETVLGFATFQSAVGTTGAVNKPATLLGTKVGPFNITTGLDDNLLVRVNGIDYSVTLPGGAAVTAAAVVSAINLVVAGVASVGTGANLNKVRLTSTINTEASSITIQNGNANGVLGFNSGDFSGQIRVTAQEVVDALNNTVAFVGAGAIAYPSKINGQNYITIESLLTGAATSSVAFGNSAGSAFNRGAGTMITPGTDGDNGADAHDQFQVTSTNPLGSSGSGVPGQTYTDARTGLRFTVLPAAEGSYTSGGFFTLTVSQTFNVAPSIPLYAIPGLETIVTNTVGVPLNDTGTVQTFNPSGLEPANGDFYYISYRYLKQDFSTRLFRTFKAIEQNYGTLSPTNRLTLAAYLAIINGAVIVALKQVLKAPNTNQATDQSFITAIKELEVPLPGNVRPDIIVPLGTSTTVWSYLTQHCEIMSNQRNQSERMGFIGFASGTSPTAAQTVAKGLNSNRMIAVYPDSAVITLTDELGNSYESLVDGTFMAAAVSGAVVSPAVDVATPYTRRKIQGFTRLPRVMDAVDANQTATSGITVLEDLAPIIRIRQGLTTNMSSVLTRLPTVTQIADYVQQQSRGTLDSFVGTKFLAQRTNEVVTSMTILFKQMVSAQIVGAFTGLNAAVDPTDPTTLQFEAYYQPVFPLLYLVLTFNLRARI